MITRSGFLRKLNIQNGETAQYALVMDQQTDMPLNHLLGKQLTLRFSGSIECIHCKRATKKSFNQGYCFVCFRRLARCDQCIIKPELCHFHLGTCREPEWGENICMKKHIVYLSVTSGIKVGITRQKNTPSRWLDQGATMALPIYEVHTRLQSGLIEATIKQVMNDKTNWRTMLKEDQYDVDLISFWQEQQASLAQAINTLTDNNTHFKDKKPRAIGQKSALLTFKYPRLEQPLSIKSINAEKTPSFTGTLIGMKGQYLMFDCGVINIRKYTGYHLELTISEPPQ